MEIALDINTGGKCVSVSVQQLDFMCVPIDCSTGCVRCTARVRERSCVFLKVRMRMREGDCVC